MLANQQADLISTIPLSNPIPSPFHRLKPLAHISRSNLFIHSFYIIIIIIIINIIILLFLLSDCLKSRLLWQWGEHDISFQYSLVHPNDNEDEEEEEGEEESKPSQLTRTSILNYIKRLKKK